MNNLLNQLNPYPIIKKKQGDLNFLLINLFKALRIKSFLKLLAALLTVLSITTKSSAQCTGIDDAQGLLACLEYLYITNTDCNSTPETVTFDLNVTINLGDLENPAIFPLKIPPNVTLDGDFNIYNTDGGSSNGTTIIFPYWFEGGYWCTADYCSTQLWYPGDTTERVIGPDDIHAAAFNMLDCSTIKDIRLIGPQTVTHDYSFYDSCLEPFVNGCDDGIGQTGYQSSYQAQTGLSSGIEVNGNFTTISDCEIYGFNLFGVMVKDLIDEVNASSPSDPTNFTIEDCYIHNCKGYGYGYGVWVSGINSGICYDNNLDGEHNWTCMDPNDDPVFEDPLATPPYYYWESFKKKIDPVEVANITRCVFFDNGHDIDGASINNDIIIENCTFGERRATEFNINRHPGYSAVCNPNGPLPANYSNTGPVPGRSVITKAGGNRTEIIESIFYGFTNTVSIH